MEKFAYNQNCCLSTPGLAITVGSSALFKYGSTFTFKANGRISPAITTANAPALTTATLIAPYPNGTASTPGVLATGYARTYTLVGTLAINGTATVTPTFSLLASTDRVVNDVPALSNVAIPTASNQAVIGFVDIINVSGSNFTPGTTALDATNVTATYVNNFGLAGI